VQCVLSLLFKTSFNSLYFLAAKSLIKDELRVSVFEKNNFWFGVKTWRRTLLRINKKRALSDDVRSTDLIFDAGNNSFDIRMEFINYFTKSGTKFKTLSLQDSIYNKGFFDKVCQISIFTLFSFITFAISLFVKNKSKIILLPVYFLESYGFVRYCLDNKITKVYYFCIYENNSNVNALLLKKCEILCCKIPSEVPLIYHNKIIIADELAICFEYQKDEIKIFSDTMMVETYLNWGPENIKKVIELFPNGQQINQQNKNTIGFFSSGNALRKLKGKPETNNEFNPSILEETILVNLNSIVLKTNYKLLICLHPFEKREENINEAIKYYKSVLSCNFIIAPIEKMTYELHNDINIALGLFSTLLFERIYLGFKTIIMPIGLEAFFPITNSRIQNICVLDNVQLYSKLNTSLNLTPKLFFELNNIIDYSPFIKKAKII
jgi:hypothetical protein